MKIYSPKQKGQGYAFEFLWNLIKVMLWIYLWGGSTCPHLLGFMFGNENYQKVSSSWCQLVFFNKMIANLHIVRTLLTNLHTKNPYDVMSKMKCHFFEVIQNHNRVWFAKLKLEQKLEFYFILRNRPQPDLGFNFFWNQYGDPIHSTRTKIEGSSYCIKQKPPKPPNTRLLLVYNYFLAPPWH
jgi:hypothetical protein